MKRILSMLALGALWAACTGPIPVALANGHPVSLVLSYVPGVSNWGPTNATGIAEVIGAEGEVRLNATGLTRLDGEQYVAWLVDSTTSETLAVAQFNVDANGSGRAETISDDPLPDKGWDTLLVTVEGAGKPPAGPGQRRSIVGYYPLAPTGTGEQPAQLPKTGNSSVSPAPPAVNPALPPAVAAGPGGVNLVLVVLAVGLLGFGAVAGWLISTWRGRDSRR